MLHIALTSRQIKAERVDSNKKAKATKAERAEIARFAEKVSKPNDSAASQQGQGVNRPRQGTSL